MTANFTLRTLSRSKPCHKRLILLISSTLLVNEFILELLCSNRLAEDIALQTVSTQIMNNLQLLLCLHALQTYADFGAVRQIKHIADKLVVIW